MQGQPPFVWDRAEGFQVPFPDGYINEDTSFDLFRKSLKSRGVAPEEIAGVLTESYQGSGANFLPREYARSLQDFCREHDIVAIYDEVPTGSGFQTIQ